jgi:hypothetical protein
MEVVAPENRSRKSRREKTLVMEFFLGVVFFTQHIPFGGSDAVEAQNKPMKWLPDGY